MIIHYRPKVVSALFNSQSEKQGLPALTHLLPALASTPPKPQGFLEFLILKFTYTRLRIKSATESASQHAEETSTDIQRAMIIG